MIRRRGTSSLSSLLSSRSFAWILFLVGTSQSILVVSSFSEGESNEDHGQRYGNPTGNDHHYSPAPDGVCTAGITSDLNGDCVSSSSTFDWERNIRGWESVYSNGGTAQAYKPSVKSQSTVCDPRVYRGEASSKYKVASWPYSRTSWPSNQLPTLSLHVRLFSCPVSKEASLSEREFCQPLSTLEGRIEIWQARPDGTYSSLRPGVDDNDCRASSPVSSDTMTFHTVFPGSTGILGGLGPGGFDTMFYGPPTIHLLVSASSHSPVLVDVPFLVDVNTLQQKTFKWPDWRGSAWIRNKPAQPPFQFAGWDVSPDRSHVDVSINVYLSAAEGSQNGTRFAGRSPLCHSLFQLLPGAFFREPLGVCVPSILDFFSI
jgi:hypothetical protein